MSQSQQSVKPCEWNHNIHYHDHILRAIPENCAKALDVGCGRGVLAQQLSCWCEEVTALDVDPITVRRARAMFSAKPRIKIVEGDIMTYPFPEQSFAFITAVATLHHLPLRLALARFRDLLEPGGVLAVIGLYRPTTLTDHLYNAVAFPVSRILRYLYPASSVGAPMTMPQESLSEIRDACESILPGYILKRVLLFRYLLVWRKPSE